ncbi:hypothetical protein KAJ27_16825, partial [bacterium]|nr:hypothetical protein [bacterium]
MTLWNLAREVSKKGEKKEAVTLYRELFSVKPRIEEALSEYVLLLMDLGEWKEAGKIILKLLETDTSSLEYLMYGGRIALIQKRYKHAAKYLGQVYTLSPDGQFAIEALRGQISALYKLGRIEMACSLMEQLYILVPHDESLIRQLAAYNKKLGNLTKARNYYTTLITEFGGTDNDFLESISLYEKVNNQEMLVKSWNGYLQNHPFYIPFHKKLSSYYLLNNFEHKALKHLLVQIAHGDETPLLFLQTGNVYLYHEGRPDKALYYYEEYRKRSPQDPEVVTEIKRIQTILAGDLLVIVENEGAWTLWRDLAKVIPDRLSVYYSMAKQLKALGKTNELLEVLEIINIHNSNDQEIILQLGHLYFDKGLYDLLSQLLNGIDPEKELLDEYLLLRIKLAEQRSEISHLLDYYRKYLTNNSTDYQLLLKSLQLAGDIGELEELNYFYSLLPSKSINSSIYKKGNFLYGEALLLNRLFTKANRFYTKLQQNITLTISEQYRINESLFTILVSEERYFEAERFLRLLLIETGYDRDIIRKLILVNRLTENWDIAWKWYRFLVLGTEENDVSEFSDDIFSFKEKISILHDSGYTEVAIELLEEFLLQRKSQCIKEKRKCLNSKNELAKLYYSTGERNIIQNIILQLPVEGAKNIELLALSLLVNEKNISEIMVFLKGKRSSILLEYSESFANFGSFAIALQLCENYLLQFPHSLRARASRAQLLRDVGDDFAALDQFQILTTEYPQEIWFKQNLLELQFKTAKFVKLIEELAPEWKSVKGENSNLSVRRIVPEIESLPIRQQLLLAKSFWADKRYDDAIILYKSLLIPAVDVEFSDRLAAQNRELSLPSPQKTFLNHITFTSPSEPNRLSVVMDPEFTRKFSNQPEVKIAANLYPAYRWQQLIGRELSVRQDMIDGNFYKAMKEYQNMLYVKSSPESLYDLAGIYSHLGFLGKEAAVYEIIKLKSPGYPDLDEATHRNNLKRLPRTSPFFNLSIKDGRDGYYNINQQQSGIRAWFMPSFNHEVEFDLSRIYSDSPQGDNDMWRNHIEARLKWSPVYDLDFLVSLGAEDPDGDYESTFLYEFQVNGRIGDGINGYLGGSQDIVYDNVESLKAGIKEQSYETGISLDLHPRLFGGADYLYRQYSDGNSQDQYELWTSYIIHS